MKIKRVVEVGIVDKLVNLYLKDIWKRMDIDREGNKVYIRFYLKNGKIARFRVTEKELKEFLDEIQMLDFIEWI